MQFYTPYCKHQMINIFWYGCTHHAANKWLCFLTPKLEVMLEYSWSVNSLVFFLLWLFLLSNKYSCLCHMSVKWRHDYACLIGQKPWCNLLMTARNVWIVSEANRSWKLPLKVNYASLGFYGISVFFCMHMCICMNTHLQSIFVLCSSIFWKVFVLQWWEQNGKSVKEQKFILHLHGGITFEIYSRVK